jgi:hypothetical protein
LPGNGVEAAAILAASMFHFLSNTDPFGFVKPPAVYLQWSNHAPCDVIPARYKRESTGYWNERPIVKLDARYALSCPVRCARDAPRLRCSGHGESTRA